MCLYMVQIGLGLARSEKLEDNVSTTWAWAALHQQKKNQISRNCVHQYMFPYWNSIRRQCIAIMYFHLDISAEKNVFLQVVRDQTLRPPGLMLSSSS